MKIMVTITTGDQLLSNSHDQSLQTNDTHEGALMEPNSDDTEIYMNKEHDINNIEKYDTRHFRPSVRTKNTSRINSNVITH